jgi:hypothetical protein
MDGYAAANLRSTGFGFAWKGRVVIVSCIILRLVPRFEGRDVVEPNRADDTARVCALRPLPPAEAPEARAPLDADKFADRFGAMPMAEKLPPTTGALKSAATCARADGRVAKPVRRSAANATIEYFFMNRPPMVSETGYRGSAETAATLTAPLTSVGNAVTSNVFQPLRGITRISPASSAIFLV